MTNMAKAVLCVILLGVLAVNGLAQTSTGEISVTVQDPSSAVIPGARVVIKGSDTGNVLRTLQTNDQGSISVPLLPSGNYDVLVSATGFKQNNRTQIPVNVGQTTDLHIQLETGSAQETVTVSGGAPLLQDKTSTLAQVITARQMIQVPLNGRSYLSVANLSPGAVPKTPPSPLMATQVCRMRSCWMERATSVTFEASTMRSAMWSGRRWMPSRSLPCKPAITRRNTATPPARW